MLFRGESSATAARISRPAQAAAAVRCDERERESLRLAPLISARRSDTRSVDLQCTRSCRHAPQCHPCARFGPFGIRHLVQPAELRLAVCRLQMSPSPGAPRLAGAPIFRFEAPDMRRRFVAPEDFLWKATETLAAKISPPASMAPARRRSGVHAPSAWRRPSGDRAAGMPTLDRIGPPPSGIGSRWRMVANQAARFLRRFCNSERGRP